MSRTVLYQDQSTWFAPLKTVTPRGWFASDAPPPCPASNFAAVMERPQSPPLARVAGSSNSLGFFWGHDYSPEVFQKPVPVSIQPFQVTRPGPIETTKTPQGWGGEQFEYRFSTTFPVAAQQYTLHVNRSITTPTLPYGWWGKQFDTAFAKPFPASEQQFLTWSDTQPVSGLAPISDGGNVFFDIRVIYQATANVYTPPTPAYSASPSFDAITLSSFVIETSEDGSLHPPISAVVPHGWEGWQLNSKFSQPFPASAQQFVAPYLYFVPPTFVAGEGWWGWPDYRFTPTFPVALQQFLALEVAFTQGGKPLTEAPQPGGGKRYKPPTDYLPEPPTGAPRKPIKPIWDRTGTIEEPAPTPKPSGPPPLPPMSLFGQKGTVSLATPQGLPTFSEYVPQNSLATKQRLDQALEESDALAALRSLGLIKDGK